MLSFEVPINSNLLFDTFERRIAVFAEIYCHAYSSYALGGSKSILAGGLLARDRRRLVAVVVVAVRRQMHVGHRLLQHLSALFDHLFFFFSLDEELLLFFDHLALEAADDVDGSDDDQRDQQNDLNATQVANQLFNAGGE